MWLRNAASRSTSTSFRSPTIGTSAVRILPISAGSMSTCTTFALRREQRRLAGHAVIEPRAERDEQVGLLQREHRGNRAVHAGHAEVLRVRVGERAARHERRHDGRAGRLGEGQQFGDACARITPPPTYSTGFFASASICAAAWICLPWALVTGR